MEKYDAIGVGYDQNRNADPYLASKILEFLQPAEGEDLLDVGCGSGNYTLSLAVKGINIVGIDPSVVMLNKAREKDPNIRWLVGKAEKIPLGSNEIDATICTMTLHHWTDLNSGLEEIYRVMKPNGRLVILTSTSEQMHTYWLNHYFPAMMSAASSRMPSKTTLLSALQASGFYVQKIEKYFVHDDLQDLFLYSGKNYPERYFNPQFRSSISSFNDDATENMINWGLQKLKEDLANNKFEEIKELYDNSLGDYLFIVSTKTSSS